jgi:hypothetical protein
MSEDTRSENEDAPTSPVSGIVVRLLDLSGGADDNIIEDIKGFLSVEHANAFARAYVRDNIEICRVPDATARETLEAWFAFGENAEVLGAEDGWRSATELDDFTARPATEEERDWRELDPRKHEFVD